MQRFKYLRIKDNWNDLKAPIEEIYEVVRSSDNECEHALKVQDKDTGAFKATLTRIEQNLEAYRNWYHLLDKKGHLKKVDSIDEELSAALVGISYFAFYSENDPRYVETRLHRFHEITHSCHERLDYFMKAKIPHFMIFRKRKLTDWRECRF